MIQMETGSALWQSRFLQLFSTVQKPNCQCNQHNSSYKSQHKQQRFFLTGYKDSSWTVSAANDAKRR